MAKALLSSLQFLGDALGEAYDTLFSATQGGIAFMYSTISDAIEISTN
jgi:hypothetical protein